MHMLQEKLHCARWCRQYIFLMTFCLGIHVCSTSPLVAYIITTIIDQDRAYVHPHLMTPGIAKLSYSFQLHANWKIRQIHEVEHASAVATGESLNPKVKE